MRAGARPGGSPPPLPGGLRGAGGASPPTAGPSLEAALRSHSTPVAVVGAVALWAVWGVVLVAVLVPHPVGLTALRMAAPGALAATVAAAFDDHGSVLAGGGAAPRARLGLPAWARIPLRHRPA